MTTLTETISELRELLDKAAPGPWLYRSQEHDDWGTIRDADGCHAARGHGGSFENYDEHRRNKTDPYGQNSLLIVAMRNALPALLDAAERAEQWEQMHTSAMQTNAALLKKLSALTQTDTAAPLLSSPAPCRMAEDGATRKDAQDAAVSPCNPCKGTGKERK